MASSSGSSHNNQPAAAASGPQPPHPHPLTMEQMQTQMLMQMQLPTHALQMQMGPQMQLMGQLPMMMAAQSQPMALLGQQAPQPLMPLLGPTLGPTPLQSSSLPLMTPGPQVPGPELQQSYALAPVHQLRMAFAQMPPLPPPPPSSSLHFMTPSFPDALAAAIPTGKKEMLGGGVPGAPSTRADAAQSSGSAATAGSRCATSLSLLPSAFVAPLLRMCLQDLNPLLGLPFVPNDLVDLIGAYAVEPPRPQMAAVLIRTLSNFQETEVYVTCRVARSDAELRDLLVAELREEWPHEQCKEMVELLGGDRELRRQLPPNAVAALAFLYARVQASGPAHPPDGSVAPAAAAAADQLAYADHMARLLHADPQLALPAEWEPLRAHFQSAGADLHVALHGSLEQVMGALAPDQSEELHIHDCETETCTTRKLVVARVDPQTGELSFQTPPPRAW